MPSPVVPNSATPSHPASNSIAICAISKPICGRRSSVSGVAAATIRQLFNGRDGAWIFIIRDSLQEKRLMTSTNDD